MYFYVRLQVFGHHCFPSKCWPKSFPGNIKSICQRKLNDDIVSTSTVSMENIYGSRRRQHLLAYSKYGMEFCNCRPSNRWFVHPSVCLSISYWLLLATYHLDHHHFPKNRGKKLQQIENVIALFGGGGVKRDFPNVTHVCAQFIHVISSNPSQNLNICVCIWMRQSVCMYACVYIYV